MINIIKDDGSKEEYKPEKSQQHLGYAVEGLSRVSISEIEMRASLSIEDGTTSKEIQQALIKSCADHISEDEDEYQIAAARLLNQDIRKDVYKQYTPKSFIEMIDKGCDAGYYDSEYLWKYYTRDEIITYGKLIDYDRDDNFVYSGLKKTKDSYLVKQFGKIQETPQEMFLLINIFAFAKYKGALRDKWVKNGYDILSNFEASLPTPVMIQVRSMFRKYISCFRGNTKIRIANLDFKLIQDIVIGDKVQTIQGNLKEVVAINIKEHTDEFITINSSYGLNDEFTSTDNHPIKSILFDDIKCIRNQTPSNTKPICITSQTKAKHCLKSKNHYKNDCELLNTDWSTISKFVEAKDLSIHDYIAIPFDNKIICDNLFDMKDFINDDKYKLINGYITKEHIKVFNLNRLIKVDADFMYILGWFAAEGCVVNNHLNFSLNINEMDYLIDIKDKIKRVFNIEGKIYDNGDNSVSLQVSHKILANFFNIILNNAKEKREGSVIHEKILYADYESQKYFLKGIFLGDGFLASNYLGLDIVDKRFIDFTNHCLLRNGFISQNSKYINAANTQCYRINIRFGLNAEFIKFVDKRTENFKIIKQLENINNIKSPKNIGFFQENILYSKIINIKKFKEVVEVYDIEVQDDHTFIANDYGVHNCNLIHPGDSNTTLAEASKIIMKLVAAGAGLGIGNTVRGLDADIDNGRLSHTGCLPIYKGYEKLTKAFVQPSRDGSSTVYHPFFHVEIESMMVWGNAKGTEETRIREMDHAITFSALFWERYANGEDITLFYLNDVKDLVNFMGDDEKFKELYEGYEKSVPAERRTTITAESIFDTFVDERHLQSREYTAFLDNIGKQGMYKVPIFISNLCTEITQPIYPVHEQGHKRNIKFNDAASEEKYWDLRTEAYFYPDNDVKRTSFMRQMSELYTFVDADPFAEVDEDKVYDYFTNRGFPNLAEVGVCILGGVNMGHTTDKRLPIVSEYLVRFLEELIDMGTYDVPEVEKAAKMRRTLGIGFSDIFHLMAINKVFYNTREGRQFIANRIELCTYHMTRTSMELAKERGACLLFKDTKYSDGLLPIDTYNKHVDELIGKNTEFDIDWPWLREQILKYGMRHSTLTANAPFGSSSMVSNSTPGIEPPRGLQVSKKGVTKLVPDIRRFGKYYTTAWSDDFNNIDYFKFIAVVQKFMDQTLSVNQYHNMIKTDGKKKKSLLIEEILVAWYYGLKTLYYSNIRSTDQADGDDEIEEEEDDGCAGGGCKV